VYLEKPGKFAQSMQKLWHAWKTQPKPKDIPAEVPRKQAASTRLRRKRVA
jgi:hypothetical protein